MVNLLRDRWSKRYFSSSSKWNAGTEFVPCIAHVIHNAVITLLKTMSADPADSNDIYDRSEEYGSNIAEEVLGTDLFVEQPLEADADQDSDEPSSSRRRTFPKLKKLKGFARTLEKLRMIAMASTNSTQRHERFQHFVKLSIGRNLQLLLDVKTRWHSTATMVKRALELKSAINEFVDEREELRKLRLTDSEWAQAEIILSSLRPFWNCALRLMESSSINTHLVYAIYNHLFDHLDDYAEKLRANSNIFTTARTQLIDALVAARVFLTKYYTATDLSTISYYASILLNSRVKSKYFLKDSWAAEPGEEPYKEKYERMLMKNYQNHYRRGGQQDDRTALSQPSRTLTSRTTTSSRSTRGSLPADILFSSDNEKDVAKDTHPDQEFHEYMAEARLTKTPDEAKQILTYWQQHEGIWPNLTLMARDVLAVPATGADVERIFSQGRNVVTTHRHNLASQTISDTMFYRGDCARKRKLDKDEEPLDNQWGAISTLSIKGLPDLFDHDNEDEFANVMQRLDAYDEDEL